MRLFDVADGSRGGWAADSGAPATEVGTANPVRHAAITTCANPLDQRTWGRLSLMTEAPGTTLAVLLAAGAGKRFHGPVHKLRAVVDTGGTHAPEPVVAASLRAMLAADIGESVVVTGAVDISDIVESFAGARVHTTHNPDWHTGMRSSLLCAIAIAKERGCDQIVVGLADQPFVASEAWQLVSAADAPIAVAGYDGRRGNPVKLARSVWDEFEQSSGDPDAGARNLVEQHLDSVVIVPCTGSDRDIDTQEDLTPWKH